MPHIVPNAEAPKDSVHYSFGSGEFDLAPGDKFETASTGLVAEALSHPWLDVEYDDADLPVATYVPSNVDPTKDPLSASNPATAASTDPAAAKAFEAEKLAAFEDVNAGITSNPEITGVTVPVAPSYLEKPTDAPAKDADTDAPVVKKEGKN